jgi:hypothetical protein
MAVNTSSHKVSLVITNSRYVPVPAPPAGTSLMAIIMSILFMLTLAASSW